MLYTHGCQPVLNMTLKLAPKTRHACEHFYAMFIRYCLLLKIRFQAEIHLQQISLTELVWDAWSTTTLSDTAHFSLVFEGPKLETSCFSSFSLKRLFILMGSASPWLEFAPVSTIMYFCLYWLICWVLCSTSQV